VNSGSVRATSRPLPLQCGNRGSDGCRLPTMRSMGWQLVNRSIRTLASDGAKTNSTPFFRWKNLGTARSAPVYANTVSRSVHSLQEATSDSAAIRQGGQRGHHVFGKSDVVKLQVGKARRCSRRFRETRYSPQCRHFQTLTDLVTAIEHRLTSANSDAGDELEHSFRRPCLLHATKLGGLMNGSTAAQNELETGRPDAGRALVPVAGCGFFAQALSEFTQSQNALAGGHCRWRREFRH